MTGTPTLLSRRTVVGSLALAAPALVLGRRAISSEGDGSLKLPWAEALAYRVHRAIGPNALAREYDPSMISKRFPINGSAAPEDPEFLNHATDGFRNWRLAVDGEVLRPGMFDMARLRGLPTQTQITRHDCVEGWSAIAQWTGFRLSSLLDLVGLKPSARYIVLHCADKLIGTQYYESIDLNDAYHPQTILAHEMNGEPLPMGYGAPLRLRVERQLGYKHAKFVARIEAVSSLSHLYGGRGGFWEDFNGYEWYAGI